MRTAPEIRFKDYSETWEQDQLSSLFHFSNGFNGSAELYGKGVPFISVLDILNNDYITYDNIRGRVSIDKSILSRFAVEYGDVVFQRSSENREDAGSSNVYIGDKPVAFGGFVIRGKKTSDNDDAIFMKNLLDSKSIREQIASKAQGAQHINVSQETLSDVLVRKPGKEEQEKIGQLLYRTDSLISTEQKKHEKLSALKRAMLDKMFPHEGEKYPEIRFNGFTEPWEQRKLSQIVTVCSGKDYKHLSTGTIPVYGTGGYMLSVNEALSYDRDAIGIGRKGTIDKPYVLKAPFWTVDTLFYAVPEQPECLNFVYDVFQIIDWKKKDESTGVPSLSKEAINDTDVMIPIKEEQVAIGTFFSRIDNLITLHQRKLQSLKSFKSAMTSKMFV